MAKSILELVRVASPCAISWESMEGDNQARFCNHCQQHVFNLSGMSKTSAEALLASREGGGPCVRYYERADGKVMTRDCFEYRMARVNRRIAAVLGTLMASFITLLLVIGMLSTPARGEEVRFRIQSWNPYIILRDWLSPPPVVMGEAVCRPPGNNGNPFPDVPQEIEPK